MSKDNPNRDLPAGEVIALFKKNLPALTGGIAADREWLWWSGPKQDEAIRKQFTDMGWRFSGKPHNLSDGRTAHWYHACGGSVVFRRKGRAPAGEESSAVVSKTGAKAASKPSGERKPAERFNPAESASPSSSVVNDFLKFSQGL